MALTRAELIARNYRARLKAIRAETMRRLEAAYQRTMREDEIEASYAEFVPLGARAIEAGQGAMQTLTRAYIRGTSGGDPVPVANLAGTTKAGTVVDALTGIAPFILGAISQGSAPSEAINVTGAYFVDRMADNEMTRVVDREINGQKSRATGWVGTIASPTDACVGNAGFHTFDEEIFRHPGCDCEREIVYGEGYVSQSQLDDATSQLVDGASAAEPQTTADIQDIGARIGLNPDARFVQNGKELNTLGARLKTEESTFRKLTGELEAKPGMTLADLQAEMKDNLRYTYVADPSTYNATVRPAVDDLIARGYEPVRATNYWAKSEGYAGLNTNWRTPDGQIFELQFHTQGSLETKEVISHPLYEAQRKLAEGSPEWDRLQAEVDAGWRSFRDANSDLGDLSWLSDVFPLVR